MVFLMFHEEVEKPLTSHKMTKSLRFPQMTSDQKNKGTLFASTLKIEEIKVQLFS